MRNAAILLLLLFMPGIVSSQSHPFFPVISIDNLPPNDMSIVPRFVRSYVVLDAFNASDCLIGGGVERVICVDGGIDGWMPIAGGATPDHGLLPGLGDNDHPQYVLSALIDSELELEGFISTGIYTTGEESTLESLLSLDNLQGSVTDAQVPLSAVSQYSGSINLSSFGGQISNGQIPSSAVTQYNSSLFLDPLTTACLTTSNVFIPNGSGGVSCSAVPPFALDYLTDVATAGQASGFGLVSNGSTWAPSAAAVCLADGSNCPASSPPTGWSNNGTTVSIDPNATGPVALSISDVSSTVSVLGSSASNFRVGPNGGNTMFLYFGADNWEVTASYLRGTAGGSIRLINGSGSSGNPNLILFNGDNDTGLWCDGSNTCAGDAGAENIFTWDNDGTNHAFTITGDTGQSGDIFNIRNSGLASKFSVGPSGPRFPPYTIVPACGAGDIGITVMDTDSTPPTACLCDGTNWQPWLVTAVGACNES